MQDFNQQCTNSGNARFPWYPDLDGPGPQPDADTDYGYAAIYCLDEAFCQG